jgi:hypothetical protein
MVSDLIVIFVSFAYTANMPSGPEKCLRDIVAICSCLHKSVRTLSSSEDVRREAFTSAPVPAGRPPPAAFGPAHAWSRPNRRTGKRRTARRGASTSSRPGCSNPTAIDAHLPESLPDGASASPDRSGAISERRNCAATMPTSCPWCWPDIRRSRRRPSRLSEPSSVPTLTEQSQLVSIGVGVFLTWLVVEQPIDGGFLEEGEAQNL